MDGDCVVWQSELMVRIRLSPPRDCPEIGGIKPPSPIVGMAGRLDEHTTEPGAEHAVVDRAADLKKQIGASPRPSHLLRFIHSPVDQEIRGTFGN